jgi:hypothetical protein
MTKRKTKPRDYHDVVADLATELTLWFATKGDLGLYGVPAMASVIVAVTHANAVSTGRGEEHFRQGIELVCRMLRERMEGVLDREAKRNRRPRRATKDGGARS